ncbi:MAG TPA: transposase [Methylomirabilota bacterium]|nr:transposase [Methylomirabilota bacterium]
MKKRLERRYGLGHLHFITFSCYRRLPLLGAERARDEFLRILNEIRDRYGFALLGYVVMPEHVHLLISEPSVGNPSVVMRLLKQRVSRALRGKRSKRVRATQLTFWDDPPENLPPRFWQRRFYDFNVWSFRKKNEKLNYMHFNPVKRGLVKHPKQWGWSSYRFYSMGEPGLCLPDMKWEPRIARPTERRKIVSRRTVKEETAHPSRQP